MVDVLVHLGGVAGSARPQPAFLGRRIPYPQLGRRRADHLPGHGVGALLVVVLLPPLYGYV